MTELKNSARKYAQHALTQRPLDWMTAVEDSSSFLAQTQAGDWRGSFRCAKGTLWETAIETPHNRCARDYRICLVVCNCTREQAMGVLQAIFPWYVAVRLPIMGPQGDRYTIWTTIVPSVCVCTTILLFHRIEPSCYYY